METRMLRWLCSNARTDNIRNEHIHRQVECTLSEDKLREWHLIWLQYGLSRPKEDTLVYQSDVMLVEWAWRGKVDQYHHGGCGC